MYFESLENRLVLSAPIVSMDGSEVFRRAGSLGKLGGTLIVNNELSAGESTDHLRFTVRSLGNVNLTLAGLSANANLRLLTADGDLVASAARTRARSDSISAKLDRGTYTIAVDRGRRAADTAYSLSLQADLNYESVRIDGRTYTLGLAHADGSAAAISASRETWVVIHGWQSKPDATHRVAVGIDASSSRNQVLELDWSPVAADANIAAVALRVDEVAAWAAAKLRSWGIPNTSLNLTGHSLGGYMTDEIARRVPGGVDRIVALDPATVNVAGVDLSDTNYAAHSRYSVAFIGSIYSTPAAAKTADQTVLLDVGRSSTFAAHANVREFFAGTVERNNARKPDRVSPLFSLKNLTSGRARPFAQNAMTQGYDAVIVAQGSGMQQFPKTLTYRDANSGKGVTVNA
jgi:pimeloyl-ACP methyl ester carboxylesterase